MNSKGKGAFLITIDTEEDNAWGRAGSSETKNSRFLPRFQEICEKYEFKTTYLTNYPMACDPFFVEFGMDVQKRGVGEIGMHLHAWNTPPLVELAGKNNVQHPLLIDFPLDIMACKIKFLTGFLEKVFKTEITSHRAGRWAFNKEYARLLVEHGYRIDCSVAPGFCWVINGSARGTDYSGFPDHAYFIDPEDISRAGNSSLLELPVTIIRSKLDMAFPWAYRTGFAIKLIRRISPTLNWLRPDGRNLKRMINVVRRAAKEKRPYIEFMIHSSELMPGGSPTFRTHWDTDQLYDDLESLFTEISKKFSGMTLSRYWELLARCEK